MKNSLCLICLCLFFCCWSVEVEGQDIETDKSALLAFYNATNDPGNPWTNATNWGTNEPVENWYGVVVENNRVTRLQLPNNNLTGDVHFSINGLNVLVELSLGFNEINNLPNLSIGTLEILNCESNNLSNLPSLNLSALEILNCSSNNITSPLSLSNLGNLIQLNCDDNQIDVLPNLNNLVNLEVLSCSSNNLTYLPFLNNQLNLTEVYCDDNLFTFGDLLRVTSNPNYDFFTAFVYLPQNPSIDISGPNAVVH